MRAARVSVRADANDPRAMASELFAIERRLYT
jgi:hypothetical protein